MEFDPKDRMPLSPEEAYARRWYHPPRAWSELSTFKKVMFALIVGLLVAGWYVSFAYGASKGRPAPEVTPSPSASPEVLPPAGASISFEPVAYYSTVAEREKIRRAGAKALQVIASPCFSDFMKARAMIQTGGRSPAQVVDHLRGLTGVVPVKMYYRKWTSAVAYRQPPLMEINLNRKAFGLSTPDCDWASTLSHESLGHSLGGYEHAYKWNAQRDYSVPYSINAGFRACCK